MQITFLLTGVFALMLCALTIKVIKLRLKHKVTLGDGNKKDLKTMIRIHGNFTEYAPLLILIIACLEIADFSRFFICTLATIAFFSRLMHFWALKTSNTRYPAMIATFTVLLVGGGLSFLAALGITF